MASQDLQKNLPHLIAIGVLVFALLIVATKTGLVGCSSLGQGYCDIYYSVLGKPTILIIRGDEGMGSPDTLARMIETQYQLPVQKLRVDQVSKGNIQDYSLIIVEHAREIPTEKLKVFYNYLFEDMGRLVWVGDAGTIGSSSDQTCRTMEYTAEWRDEGGKRIQEYEEEICVKESEVSTPSDAMASEAFAIKKEALIAGALEHIEGICADAFDGTLGVSGTKGYPCEGGSYQDIYFRWDNEQGFRTTANPWARGEYEKITAEGTEGGIDFGKSVLGVGFVADDYAVAEFDRYYAGIDTVMEGLASAHAGFVVCHNALGGEGGCSPTAALAAVNAGLAGLENEKSGAKTDLGGVVTTLKSLAQQKDARGESSSAVSSAATKMEGYIDDIEAVVIPDGVPTSMEITAIEGIATKVAGAKSSLESLRASEEDAVVKSNYDSHISLLGSRVSDIEAAAAKLRSDANEYNSCEEDEVGNVAEAISAETGHIEELNTLIAYSSPLVDENGAVDFIRTAQGSEWAALARGLRDMSLKCGDGFAEGMNSAAAAIEAAQEVRLDPATESEALAVMQVADVKHPLVQGVTRAKDLKKNDLPVPFVLVETNDVNSHEVVQLHVTPAYRNANTWPGITVKDPKFASHIFGRGVVVYYAFPPETDEVFVKNLIEFMLY
ncbi:MAG: hypothetical protein KAW41_05555 [Candidatus Diapherotrites archaeon]|nr:hypothetical protein [Candidatus Diapherotrites archaeon]